MGLLDRFRGNKPPTTRVRMNVSTGEYIAGLEYKLPEELATVWIAKGYATGDPARNIDSDELAELTALDQKLEA